MILQQHVCNHGNLKGGWRSTHQYDFPDPVCVEIRGSSRSHWPPPLSLPSLPSSLLSLPTFFPPSLLPAHLAIGKQAGVVPLKRPIQERLGKILIHLLVSKVSVSRVKRPKAVIIVEPMDNPIFWRDDRQQIWTAIIATCVLVKIEGGAKIGTVLSQR